MATKNTLSNNDRNYYYRAIKALDKDSQYIICDEVNDTLSYTDKIKSNEKIYGRPSDEEITRALIVANMITRYGYNVDNLILEDQVEYSGRKITTTAFQNDIAVLNDDGTYKSLIEVKRVTNFIGVEDPLINNQLFHPFENFTKYSSVTELYYVTCDIPMNSNSFPLMCIGIDTKKVKKYADWKELGKPSFYIDILKSGAVDEVPSENLRKTPRDATESENNDLNENFNVDTIRRSWRNIWDAIWGGTLESNNKFENFNKILIAKIYDERKTNPGSYYMFQRKTRAGVPQSDEELSYDIDLLYKKAYNEYFSKNMYTDLKDIKGIDFSEFSYSLVAKCVEELHRFSFAKNRYKNVDILGEFYEMVIRDSFKQTKGLFLTHPNIVLFIIYALGVEKLVEEKLKHPDEDSRYRLPFIIDPSCGTGTFLVYYMNVVQSYVDNNYDNISNGDIDIEDFIKREMQGENKFKWVKDYVFGMDIEPVLAMASQINQILHGDGSTNIYCADGLDAFDKYEKLDVIGANNILSSNIKNNEYYKKDSIEKFDIVISNPPFNVNVTSSDLNNRFQISGKSEAYFLERWYQLLKPSGRLGVVLPESFFSVEDDSAGRLFLYKHFNIKCIVSLPNFTFLPHTNTSTSLLFAEKKTIEEEKAFISLWDADAMIFDEKLNNVLALLVKPRDFDIKKFNDIYNSVIKKIENEFGENFIVLPYFTKTFFDDIKNFKNLKNKIKNLILNNKERWVLLQVCTKMPKEYVKFINYSVDNIGYKAGKKGAKDKPNELMKIYDSSNKQIYNLKYAHEWKKIECDNLDTVLGMITKEVKWQL